MIKFWHFQFVACSYSPSKFCIKRHRCIGIWHFINIQPNLHIQFTPRVWGNYVLNSLLSRFVRVFHLTMELQLSNHFSLPSARWLFKKFLQLIMELTLITLWENAVLPISTMPHRFAFSIASCIIFPLLTGGKGWGTISDSWIYSWLHSYCTIL